MLVQQHTHNQSDQRRVVCRNPHPAPWESQRRAAKQERTERVVKRRKITLIQSQNTLQCYHTSVKTRPSTLKQTTRHTRETETNRTYRYKEFTFRGIRTDIQKEETCHFYFFILFVPKHTQFPLGWNGNLIGNLTFDPILSFQHVD